MAYEELGRLSTPHNEAVIGIINDRGENTLKSLLPIDSNRLLYNYSSNPSIRDAYRFKFDYNGIEHDKYVFVGKNIFSIYDAVSGNFTCENPKYIFSFLMKDEENGGKNITGEELTEIIENLQYVFSSGSTSKENAYIISICRGKPCMFVYNLITDEIRITDIFDSSLIQNTYCKPIGLHGFIYFFTGTHIHKWNSTKEIYEGTLEESDRLYLAFVGGNKSSFESEVNFLNVKNKISVLHDEGLSLIVFIRCCSNALPTVSFYNYANNNIVVTHNSTLESLEGKTIKQSSILKDFKESFASTKGYITLLTDQNDIVLGSYLPSNWANSEFIISNIINAFAVNSFFFVDDGNDDIILRIAYTTINNTISFFEKDLSSISEEPIDLLNIVDGNESFKEDTLLKTTLNNPYILGQIFSILDNINIVYGFYKESDSIFKPMVKEINNSGVVHGIEFNSGVDVVKNCFFSKTQKSRLLLRAETVESESISDPDDATEVYMRESVTDTEKHTTGAYLWKMLNRLGLPYNTHVTAMGRIIIDGISIPIGNVMITKANDGVSGDVLMTFDKSFDAKLVEGAITKDIVQYPGILFFKNKGFIEDAIFSNAAKVEGAFVYDELITKTLFGEGHGGVISSELIDEKILLLSSTRGSLSSVNIQTGSYVTIEGTSVGDDAPVYFCNDLDSSNYYKYGDIIYIKYRNGFIYFVYKNGTVKKLKKNASFNECETIFDSPKSVSSASEMYSSNLVTSKDNLLIISIADLALFSIDLDTGSFSGTEVGVIGNNNITASFTNFEGQVCIKNKHYFMRRNSESDGNPILTCYDDITNLFSEYPEINDWMIDNGVYTQSSSTNVWMSMGILNNIVYVLVNDSTNVKSKAFIRFNIESKEIEELKTPPYKDAMCNLVCLNNSVFAIGVVSSKSRIMEYNVITNTWLTSPSDLPEVISKGKSEIKTINGNLYWFIVLESSNKIISIDLSKGISNIKTKVLNIPSELQRSKSVFNFTDDGKYVYLISGRKSSNEDFDTIDLCSLGDDSIVKINSYTISTPVYGHIAFVKENNVYMIGGYSGEEGSKVLSNNNARIYFPRDNKILTINKIVISLSNAAMSAIYIHNNGNLLSVCGTSGSLHVLNLNSGEYITSGSSTYSTLNTNLPIKSKVNFKNSNITSISENEEDLLIHTTDGTERFSKKIGVWFTNNYDSKIVGDVFTNNFTHNDSCIENLEIGSISPYPKAPVINGAAQVKIGKYIVFLGGYPRDATSEKEIVGNTVGNNVDRGTLSDEIWVYDTEFNVFSKHSKTLIRPRTNAYAYYIDGYIYVFGGLYSMQSYNEGAIPDRLMRTAAIERIDLTCSNRSGFTTSVIELPSTYGVPNPIVKEDEFEDPLEPQIGLFEYRFVKNKIDNEQELYSSISMSNTNEREITSSEGETVKMSGLWKFNTVSEKSYFLPADDNWKSMIGEKDVVLVGFVNEENKLYLIVYSFNSSSSDSTISVIEASTNDSLSSATYTKKQSIKIKMTDVTRGIVSPIYDKNTNSILIPYWKNIGLETTFASSNLKDRIYCALSYDINTDRLFEITEDPDNSFVLDYTNNVFKTGKTCRVTPIHSINDNKNIIIDDYGRRAKNYDRTTIYPIEEKQSVIEKSVLGEKDYNDYNKLRKLFMNNIERNEDVISSKEDPNVKYRAIYTTLNDIDLSPVFNGEGKIVILRYDLNSKSIHIDAYIKVQYGEESDVSNLLMSVYENIIWIFNKGVKDECYSFDTISKTLYPHQILHDGEEVFFTKDDSYALSSNGYDGVILYTRFGIVENDFVFTQGKIEICNLRTHNLKSAINIYTQTQKVAKSEMSSLIYPEEVNDKWVSYININENTGLFTFVTFLPFETESLFQEKRAEFGTIFKCEGVIRSDRFLLENNKESILDNLQTVYKTYLYGNGITSFVKNIIKITDTYILAYSDNKTNDEYGYFRGYVIYSRDMKRVLGVIGLPKNIENEAEDALNYGLISIYDSYISVFTAYTETDYISIKEKNYKINISKEFGTEKYISFDPYIYINKQVYRKSAEFNSKALLSQDSKICTSSDTISNIRSFVAELDDVGKVILALNSKTLFISYLLKDLNSANLFFKHEIESISYVKNDNSYYIATKSDTNVSILYRLDINTGFITKINNFPLEGIILSSSSDDDEVVSFLLLNGNVLKIVSYIITQNTFKYSQDIDIGSSSFSTEDICKMFFDRTLESFISILTLSDGENHSVYRIHERVLINENNNVSIGIYTEKRTIEGSKNTIKNIVSDIYSGNTIYLGKTYEPYGNLIEQKKHFSLTDIPLIENEELDSYVFNTLLEKSDFVIKATSNESSQPLSVPLYEASTGFVDDMFVVGIYNVENGVFICKGNKNKYAPHFRPIVYGAPCTKSSFFYGGNMYTIGKKDSNSNTVYKITDVENYTSILDIDSKYDKNNIIDIHVCDNGSIYLLYKLPSESEGVGKIGIINLNVDNRIIVDEKIVTFNISGLLNNSVNILFSENPAWIGSTVTLIGIVNEEGVESNAFIITINAFTGTVLKFVTENISANIASSIDIIDNYIVYSNGFNDKNKSDMNRNIHFRLLTSNFKNDLDSSNHSFNKLIASTEGKSGPTIKTGKKILTGVLSDNNEVSVISYNTENKTTAEDPLIGKKRNTSDLQYNLPEDSDSFFRRPGNKNVVYFGFRDEYTSNENKLSLIGIKVCETPIDTVKIGNYYLHIYSGPTQDTYVVCDSKDLTIIDKISIPHEYGITIRSYLKADSKTLYIFSDGAIIISTIIIQDNGMISFKRYDGKVFGKSSGITTNEHTIQDVDLTLFFDVESSEFSMRE